jgi:hypothetical protein
VTIVQPGVGNHGRKACKTNTVGESKEGGDAERSCLIVTGLGQRQGFLIKDAKGGVLVALGREESTGEDREALSLSKVGVIGDGDHNPGDEEETQGNVDLGLPGDNQS